MNITATSPGTGLQTRAAIERPHPLIRVMAWELRRFCASRLFWVQALGFFGLSLFLTWAQQIPLTLNHAHATVPFYGFVAGTSAWGLFLTLPTGTLMLLGMLLPFVNADGVTRDLSRRTHELLLATALPTWAYVWGRYLVGLLISLALSVLALAAILVMGLFLHLTITGHPLPEIGNHIADYPLPQISNVMVIWIGMVASATVLVSSLSFALGTLLPRLTTLVKMVILLGWFVGAQVPSILFGDASHAANFSLPAWYIHWDPTSVGTALGLFNKYFTDFSNLASKATSTAQTQHILLTVENTLIDIWGWFAPHLLLAGFSLVLVLVAALAFKRSRDTLS
jgi:ABC-type transport system involved in multi-copper enzyme maturation permease subunit